jgi:preprotein translocase subunit YajC
MFLANLFLQTSTGSGSSSLMMWLPIVLIFVIMYFLILRPQAKRQKDHQKMLGSLKQGDKIVTAGGIHGTIAGIKEKEQTLLVKISDNVKVELARGSVARKVESAE